MTIPTFKQYIYILALLILMLLVPWFKLVITALTREDPISIVKNVSETLIFVNAQFSPFKYWNTRYCNYKCNVTFDSKYATKANMFIYDIYSPKYPSILPHSNQKVVINAYYEAPAYNTKKWTSLANKLYGNIDYTLTYREDSDFVEKRMRLVQKPTMPTKYQIRRGNRFLTWFVSNCFAKERLKKYQHMQKYFTKDEKKRTAVYGKCFNNYLTQCGIGGYKTQNITCLSEYISDHKFYIAFENTRCSQYITEKSGIGLKHGAIPIVMGGKSRKDYEDTLPPNSFIYADDFKHTKDLVTYMRYLDKNDTAFDEYFKWQYDYEMLGIGWGQTSHYANRDVMCKVCGVASGQIQIPKRETNFDFVKWWSDDQCI